MGLRRPSMAMNEEEKELIAYHEGGHAVLAYVLEHADPVHKVTILPTGMALGVTQQLPVEERHSTTRSTSPTRSCVLMGGRIAEEIVFGTKSTGAQNDLVGATEMARKMVREWGMSRPHRADGVGLTRARCSSARTSCTRATTPTRPPG